ncbi:BRO-N domain-containing protein [Neisseria polysaccharea]|uniref:BRO-N domain-containing protein n=2 Tax=Neisseria polysaccharea TaxID=489 RepID=UPI00272D51AC|nr:BRO family protein [Neisseria polysaccharea]
MTLSIFQFQAEQSVRVEFQNNEPLFCLTDVARILEISNANPLRFNMKRDGVHKMYSVDTKGRKNEITYINEPNLYRVIFRSNKPEAVKFQDWIFEEVIPQIRKTGGYQITPKTTADDRTGLRQAVAALVGRKGIDYSSAYSMIHQRFNVEAIEDIPAEKLPEAVAYVHALTLHTGLTGEVLDREPLPAPQPALPISGNALYDLAVAVRYGAWAIQMGKDVSAPLKQLGCKQAVTMWTVWAETRSRLKAAANALEALNAHADAEHAAKIRPMLPEIRNLSSV